MPRATPFVVLAVALMVAPLTVLAECNVRPGSLRGAWKHVNNAGFFEQMEFTSEGERNIFNSWLHDRPEFAGASWSLKNCVLRIWNPRDPALSFVYSVRMQGAQRLNLREAGQPNAEYRRIKAEP